MKSDFPTPAKRHGRSAARETIKTEMSRRRFLIRSGPLAAIISSGLPSLVRAASNQTLPIGEAFDLEVEEFMSARNIPGGALAVLKDQRLVYARGYGWADREKKEAVQPDSLFRIASISKPFTAIAVLKLAEQGRLDLDAPAFALLKSRALLPSGKKPDERLARVTIRQLLHHTGGWDRNRSFDPMFRSTEISIAAAVASPAKPEVIIRYMLGQKLDFEPGTRYAYSNFGYCVLGRIIEKISGLPYERFVQDQVLAPIGVRRMRIGASLAGHRAAGEVKYYVSNGARGRSVFPTLPGTVPQPYGAFYLEAMDSHGGWLASAVDLARFAAALNAPDQSKLLNSEMNRVLYEPPAPPVYRNGGSSAVEAYYACGWQVRPVGAHGKANYWHNGSLPGTATLLVRRADGLAWAMLFNQRSQDSKLSDSAIDPALHRAANAVAEWPKEDLFSRYAQVKSSAA